MNYHPIHHQGVYGWLVDHGLWNYVLGWTIGALMTAIIAGVIVHRIITPTVRYLKAELHHHRKVQDKISSQLDTSTPGGLTTINNTLLQMQPQGPGD